MFNIFIRKKYQQTLPKYIFYRLLNYPVKRQITRNSGNPIDNSHDITIISYNLIKVYCSVE